MMTKPHYSTCFMTRFHNIRVKLILTTLYLLHVVLLQCIPCFCSNCVLLMDSCDNKSVFSDTKTSIV